MYKLFFKSVFDFVLSLVFVICFSPLLLVLTVVLYFSNKGVGVFFFQNRPGKDGKIFEIIKYKTMTDEVDKEGNLSPDSNRLTKIGRFMRLTSLDELPQLLNVIKGDMSFVGPRPLAVKYLPYYTEEEKTRHDVKPGITGLAQINGRNAINWDLKLQYDVEYVRNQSFRLDVVILFKTFIKMVTRNDVSISGIDAPGDFDKYRLAQIINNKSVKQSQQSNL